MVYTSLTSVVLSLLALLLSVDAHGEKIDAFSIAKQYPETATEDTLVNYNKLLRAAYFYGQKFADKKLGLTTKDVEFFNDVWKDVFSLPTYQTGIAETEFILGARFGEGNLIPFPPSSLYLPENPDTYLLFHIAKEIGMIQSKSFSTCPSCVELSIAKINAYFKITQFGHQIPVLRSDGTRKRKLQTREEIVVFWDQLNQYFPDKPLNPKTDTIWQ